MQTQRLDRRTWNTYATRGYSAQAGTDPRATGGVQHHQVRFYHGSWQTRAVDSNGRFASPGPVSTVDAEEGLALFATACQE